jgi:polyhydroxybutyrate depolymerase
MSNYSNFKDVMKATFLGRSETAGPQATVFAASLMRPEGERRYLVGVPGRPATSKRPLVIILHGAGASAEQVLGMAFPPSPLSVWLEIAEREDLVVIAADAGKGGWSDCLVGRERVARKDDVAFIGAIIDRAIDEQQVDREKVYVIGVSRGGLMSYRVACEIPHKLAAFSSVLAAMPPLDQKVQPTRALPALIVGCTADPLLPYYGGKYFYTLNAIDPVGSIEDGARLWRELAGLADNPRVDELPHLHSWDKTRVTRFLWGEAPDQLQVALYRIDKGGHAEPSGRKRYPYLINYMTGAQNADFEVAEAAWEFFKDKRARYLDVSQGEPPTLSAALAD